MPQSPAFAGESMAKKPPRAAPMATPMILFLPERSDASMDLPIDITVATTATSGCPKLKILEMATQTVTAMPVFIMRMPSLRSVLSTFKNQSIHFLSPDIISKMSKGCLMMYFARPAESSALSLKPHSTPAVSIPAASPVSISVHVSPI